MFWEFSLQKNCQINSAHQKILGVVEMTFWLVNASFKLPKWQAVNVTFFAPCIKFHLGSCCADVLMLLIDYNFFVQHENGSSYSQRDTVKRESLDLWRHKKKTCHLSMLGKSFEIMVTCPVGNTDMTKGCTSGKTMLLYILVFS